MSPPIATTSPVTVWLLSMWMSWPMRIMSPERGLTTTGPGTTSGSGGSGGAGTGGTTTAGPAVSAAPRPRGRRPRSNARTLSGGTVLNSSVSAASAWPTTTRPASASARPATVAPTGRARHRVRASAVANIAHGTSTASPNSASRLMIQSLRS